MKLLCGWLPPDAVVVPLMVRFALLVEYWLTFDPAHTAPAGELEEPPDDWTAGT